MTKYSCIAIHKHMLRDLRPSILECHLLFKCHKLAFHGRLCRGGLSTGPSTPSNSTIPQYSHHYTDLSVFKPSFTLSDPGRGHLTLQCPQMENHVLRWTSSPSEDQPNVSNVSIQSLVDLPK